MKKILPIFCFVSATALGGWAGAEGGPSEEKPASLKGCFDSSDTYSEWTKCVREGEILGGISDQSAKTFELAWWEKALILRPHTSYGRGYWRIDQGERKAPVMGIQGREAVTVYSAP